MFQHPNPYERFEPGRNWNSDQYRFGFNGKENDNEVKGTGNQQDYGMRIYDPRIARFLSADPLIVQGQKYPWYSPYQFAGNKPIWCIDLDGLEDIEVTDVDNTKKTATMVIHYTEVVITTGPGKVNNQFIDRLKSDFFQSNYKKILSNEYLIQTKSLPTEGNFDVSTESDINGNEWNVKVKFDVGIEIKEDYSFETFLKDYKGSSGSVKSSVFNGHGAIVESDGSPGFTVPDNTWENIGAHGAAYVGDFRTWVRPNYAGEIGNGSYKMVIHEMGHKFGLDHDAGDYSQIGMMNNFKVTPTKENVIDILTINKWKIR